MQRRPDLATIATPTTMPPYLGKRRMVARREPVRRVIERHIWCRARDDDRSIRLYIWRIKVSKRHRPQTEGSSAADGDTIGCWTGVRHGGGLQDEDADGFKPRLRPRRRRTTGPMEGYYHGPGGALILDEPRCQR